MLLGLFCWKSKLRPTTLTEEEEEVNKQLTGQNVVGFILVYHVGKVQSGKIWH